MLYWCKSKRTNTHAEGAKRTNADAEGAAGERKLDSVYLLTGTKVNVQILTQNALAAGERKLNALYTLMSVVRDGLLRVEWKNKSTKTVGYWTYCIHRMCVC